MPLSKAKKRLYMQKLRESKRRAAGAVLLSKADTRAMRKAGLRPEDLEGESGANVTFQVFSALLRDRDAIKAHMEWHHESMKNPDVATILERASRERAKVDEGRIMALEARNMQVEADLARLEVMMDSMLREGDLS